jgi:hypothetical protein
VIGHQLPDRGDNTRYSKWRRKRSASRHIQNDLGGVKLAPDENLPPSFAYAIQ